MLAIGTPYKENSIIAIAQSSARRSTLETFYTTTYTGKLIPIAKLLPFSSPKISLIRELQRRSYADIPASKVRTLATLSDLSQVASRRLHFVKLTSRLVLRAKQHFDLAMALAFKESPADAVLGMWGSSLQTFLAARTLRKFTVMNFVNSHPNEQNRLVLDLGGAPDGHHELVARSVVAQVDREINEADLILVPSHFVARQLLARDVPATRILIEPYGVDLRAFSPPREERDYTCSRRLQVLVVAMISHRKGTRDILLAARRMLRDADFHLLGQIIDPALLSELPPNVIYHGVKDQVAVVSAMHAADVLVLPSVEDAYGLVVPEAMATGLPVVLSDHVGGCEGVTHGEDGFVFPVTDVSALVSYLRALHEEPERRRAMGESARNRVERASSWATYADRVLNRIDADVVRAAR